MTDLIASPVLDTSAHCGEGPLWLDRRQSLAWIDMTRPALHVYSPADATDRAFGLDEVVGSVVLPEPAGDSLLLAGSRGLRSIDLRDGQVHAALPMDLGRPDAILNDSRCDLMGNLWVGMTTLGEVPGAGALLRISPQRKVDTVLRGLTIPNGMDWSPDGNRFYLADSPTRRVDVFAFDPEHGALGDRRPFVTFAEDDGFPDGLTVDAAGFVWVAHWGGARVSRFDPAGQLDKVLSLPVTRVSSCGFGGHDLRDLYITTASRDFGFAEPAGERYGGALFRRTVCTPGRSPRGFTLEP